MVTIGINQQRQLREEQMADCRSLGSNYLRGSQSRKISIGVMADDYANVRSGARKEGGSFLRDIKMGTDSKVKLVEENCKGSQSVISSKGKQAEASKQDTSPWTGTRSLNKEMLLTKRDCLQSGVTMEGGALLSGKHKVTQYGEKLVEENCKGSGSVIPSKGKQADAAQQCTSPWICTRSLRQEVMMTKKDHLPATQKNKPTNIKEPPVETVQFYTNRTSILHSEDGVQRKFDSVIHGRARQKGGNTERVEAFAFAAAEEVHVSGEGVEEEKSVNRSNEALRTKLSELLGTAASPKEDDLSCQDPEVEVKGSKSEQTFNPKSNKASKPRHNSDTIETDSEGPDRTTKRPMTRSLSRKQTRTTAKPEFHHKLNSGGNESPFLSYKRRCQQTDTFSFDEAEGRPQKTVIGNSSAVTCKKKEKNVSGFAPRKILFSAKGKLGKNRRGTRKSRSPASSKRMSSHSNSTKSYHSLPPHSNREHVQQSDENLEIHHSPEMKKRDQQEDLDSLRFTKKGNPEGNFYSSPLKKYGDPLYDANSPTFGMGPSIKSCTPIESSMKSKSTENGVNSHVPAERQSTEGFHTWRSPFTSNPCSFEFGARTKFSDNMTEHKESSARESPRAVEEKRSEDRPSPSSSEQDADCSEEDLPMKKGCKATKTLTPEIDNLDTPPFMLHRNKRLRSEEESIETMGPSDENHEDGLSRAVALLASALARFKTKMYSHTSKKSSEILTTIAEGIQLQLHTVESQIQADIGKLATVAKSKKRSVESRFLEQQERLNLIREKFKEDVNEHLKDCRSALEELEVYQRELEGNAEKQNALHRKLLLQAEEGIAAQLSDAERRITTVNKVAKEKMFQLKHVIMECLQEGVFS